MLGTLDRQQKSNCKAYVAPMVHPYNCTRHESTGVAPYFLMFGRQPRLPIDLAFGLHKDTKMPATKYIQGLRDRLACAYQLATEASKKAQATQKEAYDLRVRGASIQKGDRVLVKIVYFDGRHKLAEKWKDVPYDLLDQPNQDIPVFTVIREDGEGKIKKFHRNLLLPVGYIRDQEPVELQTTKQRPTPRPRASKQQKIPVVQATKEDSADDTASTISEDCEVGFVLTVDSESSLAEDSNANIDIIDEDTGL
ncbi:uncharacterized protein LOC127711879 [Mytilus californianus]|uniref:uncharacterized protein LOC127711879 n=1 Tax=Mytilus californianus TaxID=6549 RepID=UPI002245A92F|nr:uncharacterized protein LOC127711879 [Mytilus californianus]